MLVAIGFSFASSGSGLQKKLLLALRTIMRSPAADHDLLDRRFAGQAGLAFAAIGAVLDLEEAGLAVSINVVRN